MVHLPDPLQFLLRQHRGRQLQHGAVRGFPREQVAVVADIDGASLIHSIDSEKLLFAVNDRAKSLNLVQSVLLEVNIANDENKHGFNKQDLFKAISSAQNCDNLNIQGLMTVLPKCENKDNLCELCLQMRSLYDIIKESQPNFCTLSMGMSGDYQTAIQNGSNLIRIGSLLFGERKYNKNGD